MKIIFACLLFFCFNLFADGGSSERVQLVSQQKLIRAGVSDYVFMLWDTEKGKSITEDDLQDSHTKKLHFIMYDEALKEFSHLHPEKEDNLWRVEINVPVTGNYFIWAQGKLNDGEEFSSRTQAEVINGLPANVKHSMGDVRKGTDNLTTVELANTKLKANQMAMLSFKVSRQDGVIPVMAPYLGAFAHVIGTSTDGDELLHVHPMAGGQPNTGILHATFPKAGEYRIWVQFIEHDELKTIPLSVVVN